MYRYLLSPAVLFFALLGPGVPAEGREVEDAVYVYDLFQPGSGCPELLARLRRLPLRSTVILSIEQGPEFVLDHPHGEGRLTCVLRFLRASKRKAKALFLQDAVFLERGHEVVRRATRLGEFIQRHPGELAGAQVDVEPYGQERWKQSSAAERSRSLGSLHELLRRVRPQLRGLPLGAAIPWWYAGLARELPEAAPEALFQEADELYLMAYGDGDSTEGGDPPTSLLARIAGAYGFSGTGRTHVVLATYEFPSLQRLQSELKKVRRALASRPNFAGTAVFHANSGFQATAHRSSGVR